MKQEEPYRNQAERLRQKIEKVKDGVLIDKIETKHDVDQGNYMPSRADIHRNKKNKTKLKVKFPIIRLLALFFILLPIVIFSAYSYLGSNQFTTSENVVNVNNSGFEEVKLGDKKEEIILDTLPSIEENSEEENVEENENKETTIDEQEVDDQKVNEKDKVDTDIPSTDKDQTTSTIVAEKSSQDIVYHTVQSKDTLFRIAMKYYQSQAGIEIIQEANQLQGNEIKVGQVLKIPK